MTNGLAEEVASFCFRLKDSLRQLRISSPSTGSAMLSFLVKVIADCYLLGELTLQCMSSKQLLLIPHTFTSSYPATFNFFTLMYISGNKRETHIKDLDLLFAALRLNDTIVYLCVTDGKQN